jgi:hypothetical protein
MAMATFAHAFMTQGYRMYGNNVSIIIAHALTVILQAAIKELTGYGRASIGVHLAASG